MNKRKHLAVQVKNAFAWRTYPGDNEITRPAQGCPDSERAATQEFFQGKHWQEITCQSILDDVRLDVNFFIFSLRAKSFLYFLPAFLTILLEPHCDYDLEGTILDKISPPARSDPGELNGPFLRTMENLTEDERRVIVRVLELLAMEYEQRREPVNEPRKILDQFWKSFAEKADTAGSIEDRLVKELRQEWAKD